MALPYETMNISLPVSTAKIASFNSDFFRYYDPLVNGCIIYIDVTVAGGTLPTLLAQVQAQDPASLKWVNIQGAVTASIITTGTTSLALGKGLTGVANSIINTVLPNTMRIAYTIGGTSPSFTFTTGVTFTT